MRTLPAQLQQRIASDYTAPGYLAALTFADGAVLRFSSRGMVTWGGQTFALFADIQGVQQQAGGGMTASMTCHGDDVVSQIAQHARAGRATVEIWQGDGDDMLLAFSGQTTQIQAGGATARIEASNWTPRREIRIAAPLVEYITPRGTIIDWGGKRVILGE